MWLFCRMVCSMSVSRFISRSKELKLIPEETLDFFAMAWECRFADFFFAFFFFLAILFSSCRGCLPNNPVVSYYDFKIESRISCTKDLLIGRIGKSAWLLLYPPHSWRLSRGLPGRRPRK